VAPWLAVDVDASDRFGSLLLPALDEAMEPLDGTTGGPFRLGLALALPADRPGLPDGLAALLRRLVGKAFPGRFSGIGVFPVGHAAGLLALDEAWRRIADKSFDACVVAGVESYLAPDTLEWLEELEQLHGAGVTNNAWGFIPGEAAGAVLVMGAAVVERIGLEPLGEVLGVGVGREHNLIKTDSVCVGKGLTTAFRRSLSPLPVAARVSDVFCDMNGEPYRADEFGFACLRTKERFESASDFVAPADCWGDVSAASGPLGLTLAVAAGRKGYSRGAYSLIWTSSESGERAAALVQPERTERV